MVACSSDTARMPKPKRFKVSDVDSPVAVKQQVASVCCLEELDFALHWHDDEFDQTFDLDDVDIDTLPERMKLNVIFR